MAIYSEFDSRWSTENGSAYVGKIFVGDEMKRPKDVFDSVDKESVLNILNEINGFWGAVVTDGDRFAWIASDRIRSYPIFYAQQGKDLFISSDAYWILKQSGITEIDKVAKEEFLIAGYVTGADTLFLGLKQIQQGEIIFFEWSADEGKYILSLSRYYRYLHKAPDESSVDVLLDKLDNAMLSSFKRLIDFADGNTIVIPLSGGYDSRLVALMLKRLGYNNLMAYTYGVKDNEESMISRKIADTLNIPWFFVEYTQEKWHETYHSEEYKNYVKFSGGLASLPHIQDLIAVMELKQKKLIPHGAIFLPGLSADLLAGSRSKSVPKIYKKEASLDDSIDSIINYHYSNVKNVLSNSLKKWIYGRINIRIGKKNQYINAASLFESFDVSERQAKYINNSVRVYEFCGYSWWTPFWDKEFFDFWSKVSLHLRIKQNLYLKYLVLQSKLSNLFVGDELYRNNSKKTNRRRLGQICRIIFPNALYLKIRYLTTSPYKHPLSYYGCWSSDEIKKHEKKGNKNIISMLSYEYIENLKNEIDNLT